MIMKKIVMQKSGLKVQQKKKLKSLNQSYITRLEWYKLPKWRAVRHAYLEKYPVCIECGAPATVCDHVEGHDPLTWKDNFWAGPFQPMCQSCHSRKTVAIDMQKKSKRLTNTEKLKLLNEFDKK